MKCLFHERKIESSLFPHEWLFFFSRTLWLDWILSDWSVWWLTIMRMMKKASLIAQGKRCRLRALNPTKCERILIFGFTPPLGAWVGRLELHSVSGVGIDVHRPDLLPGTLFGPKSKCPSNGGPAWSNGALDDIFLSGRLCLVPVCGGSKDKAHVPVPSSHGLDYNSSLTSHIHHEEREP